MYRIAQPTGGFGPAWGSRFGGFPYGSSAYSYGNGPWGFNNGWGNGWGGYGYGGYGGATPLIGGAGCAPPVHPAALPPPAAAAAPTQAGGWWGGPWGPGPGFFNSPPDPWPYTIPPRNLLVDRPGPTGADRVILPMSSGVNILPNTSAQITSRPQNYAFRPERCIISGAADWVINDIKVGNMSQFSQSGDVPGEMFGATTIDGFVKFTTCQTAMDFVIVTTFVGASESGAPFVCGVLGTAAVN